MTTNEDVKQFVKSKGVKLWQIAEKLGMNDGNFSRKLRHPLSPAEKQKIVNIVENLCIGIN